MIQASLSGDKILSASKESFLLYDKSSFGEKVHSKIQYAPVEALFLASQNKLQVYQNSKIVPFESLLSKLKRKDKKMELKLAAYSDLRNRGYIPKTALKFGADFRVYKKGTSPGQEHAPWLLQVASESQSLKLHDFSAKARVAHSTRKKLLLAIVDDENSVTYYETGWLKL